jgi:hypothetical protein
MQYDLQIKQIGNGHFMATSRRINDLRVYASSIQEVISKANIKMFPTKGSQRYAKPVA